MTNTPSTFISHLPNHDPFSISVQTSYASDLERQIRLERLSHFFDKLKKKKETIRNHIKDLKSLQEDIKRLDKEI